MTRPFVTFPTEVVELGSVRPLFADLVPPLRPTDWVEEPSKGDIGGTFGLGLLGVLTPTTR